MGVLKSGNIMNGTGPSLFFYKCTAPPDVCQHTPATDFSDVTMGNSVVAAAV